MGLKIQQDEIFKKFYWSIAVLQCWVISYCTAKWVSYMYTYIPSFQRRQWHPTPVLLPGKSDGWKSLEGCSPWVTEGWTRLSDFTFTFHFHALKKEMATHSSVLAWRIPGMGEPGWLPSMGSHRVGHDWSNLASPLFIFPSHLGHHRTLNRVPWIIQQVIISHLF